MIDRNTTQPVDQPKLGGHSLFFEIMGWLQIVASPLLIGAIIGFVLYVSIPGQNALIVGLAPVILGLIVGVIWANRIWKKGGTSRYMSRAMSSPEFDDIKKD